jgi:hypothetical protein
MAHGPEGPAKAIKPSDLKALKRELRDAKRAGSDSVTEALRLLREESTPDPASFPTRQQRRQAERQARKRGTS